MTKTESCPTGAQSERCPDCWVSTEPTRNESPTISIQGKIDGEKPSANILKAGEKSIVGIVADWETQQNSS